MKNIILYHNPRCSKSREALKLLQARQVEPTLRLYLENPPSQDELLEVLTKLGIAPRELLRKGEQEYKDNSLADETLTDEQLVSAMAQHPRLIERPIAITTDRAVIGRPPEAVLELI